MKCNLLVLLVCGFAVFSANAGDCTCRAKGVVAGEGQVACLSTPQGRRLARCQKVLNNTSWEFMEESCGDMFTRPVNPESDESEGKKPA